MNPDGLSTTTWIILTICFSAFLVHVIEAVRNRLDKRKAKK